MPKHLYFYIQLKVTMYETVSYILGFLVIILTIIMFPNNLPLILGISFIYTVIILIPQPPKQNVYFIDNTSIPPPPPSTILPPPPLPILPPPPSETPPPPITFAEELAVQKLMLKQVNNNTN